MNNSGAESSTPGSQGSDALFPIRTVATLTGVNATTLRAWERRYGLITPVRTDTGHRLYTQAHIDLIQRVTEFLGQGISIGQVQRKLSAETQAQGEPTGADTTTDRWQVYQRRMFNAVLRFDAAALDEVYNEALALYPVDFATHHLVMPLLLQLGERWRAESGGGSAEFGAIAEEHFFGIYLRNKLGARFHHHTAHAHGPVLVLACLPGEQHEVGLMLFGLAALDFGFRVVLLGANLPLRSLPVAVTRSQAAAVVLSGSVALDAQRFAGDLVAMTQSLPIPVFIGGGVAGRYHDLIVAAQAVPLGTDIPAALKRIAAAVGFAP